MSMAASRLDYRVSPDVKEMIRKAASLCGLTETSFAVSALAEKARQVIQDQTVTKLSGRDWEKLNALLQSDAEPSARLRAAAQRFRKKRE